MANVKHSQSLRVIPLTIDETRLQEGAQSLISQLRPDWSPGDVEFQVYKTGLMNTLVGCRLRDGSDPGDVVLVRVYGRGTNQMVDREQEINIMLILNAVGRAAPVYCRFDNGVAYGYQPGVILDCDTVRQPEMQKLIIEELVNYHSIDMNSLCAAAGNGLHFDDTRSPLFPSVREWLSQLPDTYADQSKQAKLNENGMTKQQLMIELQDMETMVESLNSPIVLCHNDLNPNNIIYSEQEHRVSFVDFELVTYNYQAFEIACHFGEYAGTIDIDFSRYPSRDYQLNWLRMYLESSFKHRGLQPSDVTDLEVERLYVQVQKFALITHLCGTIWALFQSDHSTIDYIDFVNYALLKWDEYKARKESFVSLKMP